MTFKQEHWFLKDLQYEYLDDGYKFTATTDVPCHLYCRMTTTPPRKHALPSYRRGLALQGDIRFCFVVYEDNEQDEAGDTLTHTWYKQPWQVCETRWFYFVGTIGGTPVVSESPIFKFHFPAPPPEPPPPLLRVFFAQPNNRHIRSNNIAWPACRAGSSLIIHPWYAPPTSRLVTRATLTASFFIARSFLFFDTSIMPDTALIQSAELVLYAENARRTSAATHPYLQVTKGHQNDPVVIGDWYAQTSEVLVLGQIDLDAIVNNAYNPIPLNQDGIGHINLAGETKYCVRQQMDTDNFRPPLGTNEIYYHSEQKGAGFYPRLEVTYYPA